MVKEGILMVRKGCLGTSGFVAPIGGKRREEPRSPAKKRDFNGMRERGF